MSYSRRTLRKLLEFLDGFDRAFLPQNVLIRMLDLLSKGPNSDSSRIRLLVANSDDQS